MTHHWDGTETLPFVEDDGGRSMFFKGSAGDCVCRAVAIAAEMPYDEVYQRLSAGVGTQRKSKHATRRSASARNGITVKRKWFKDFMQAIGFEWTPTMQIGQGCTVHLLKGELPMGRLVVSVSGHYTAVIDGVIHDTHDPSRATLVMEGNNRRLAHRCVYGYWKLKGD